MDLPIKHNLSDSIGNNPSTNINVPPDQAIAKRHQMSRRTVLYFAAGMALLYTLYFSATTILEYQAFGMSAYDFGMHIQAIWNLAFGHGLFNTIRGMNVWGDHCWFIMMTMAPFYRIAPHPETLLIFQSALLALGALPLACFVYRRTGGRSLIALAFLGAWLLSPALQNMNLEQFHPEVVATSLLMLAVDRADAKHWKVFWPALLLALCCKEDIALTGLALGVWITFTKSKKPGIFAIIVCILWFILCLKVVLPLLNGEGFFRAKDGYWFSELAAHRFDIDYYLHNVFNMRAANYLVRLLAPLLFLSLLDPFLLLCMAPSFLVNLLSGNDYLISIDYHYNNQTLPFIFAAAAAGIGRCIDHFPRLARPATISIAIAVFIASAATNALWSHAPIQKAFSRLSSQSSYVAQSSNMERLQSLMALLEDAPNIAVCATHNLVPALANREHIYMLPNPFMASYWGIRGENLPSPEIVQAIVLDANAANPEIQDICAALIASNRFTFVKRQNNFVLLQRSPIPAYEIPSLPESAHSSSNKVRMSIYCPGGSVTSLYELFRGETPLIVRTTHGVQIPRSAGPLLTTEGESLGGVDNLRIVLEGQWSFHGADPVIFRAQADDGCRLYVDGRLILDHAGIHSFDEVCTSAPIKVTPGLHDIRVDYFEWGGEAGLSISWARPNQSFQQLEAKQTLP